MFLLWKKQYTRCYEEEIQKLETLLEREKFLAISFEWYLSHQ